MLGTFYLVGGALVEPLATPTGTKRPDPKRFEKEIAKFDAQFEEKPVKGGIVFTGSSNIKFWKVEESFPGLPVLNRGFGGSVANDLIVYADKVVFRYEPKVLVVYTGSNDINAKLTVEEAFKDYTLFPNPVHERATAEFAKEWSPQQAWAVGQRHPLCA